MDEYISREETIKRIKECYCTGCNSYNGVRCRACGTGDAIDVIEDAPVADVATVVHGRWVVRFDGPYKRRRCYCSHCGKHNGVGGIAQNQEKPYCPNCGAKMDGGSD